MLCSCSVDWIWEITVGLESSAEIPMTIFDFSQKTAAVSRMTSDYLQSDSLADSTWDWYSLVISGALTTLVDERADALRF